MIYKFVNLLEHNVKLWQLLLSIVKASSIYRNWTIFIINIYSEINYFEDITIFIGILIVTYNAQGFNNIKR